MTEAAETRQAKKSALMVGAILLLIAGWNVWKERPAVYLTLGAIGLLLVLAGLLWPAGSVVFHRAWMRFAHALGYVNSRILLSLMFYLVFTPFGLMSRVLGRDPLRRRGPGGESYWIPRPDRRQRPEQFERLF